MSGMKILLLLSIIAFALGALSPVFVEGGSPRSINWLCLGFCFAVAAWFVAGLH
jgi:hypothetical protein